MGDSLVSTRGVGKVNDGISRRGEMSFCLVFFTKILQKSRRGGKENVSKVSYKTGV